MNGEVKYIIDTDKKVIVLLVESEGDLIAISSLLPIMVSVAINFDRYKHSSNMSDMAHSIPSIVRSAISFAGTVLRTKVDMSKLADLSSSILLVEDLLNNNKQIIVETSDGWKIGVRKV